MAEIGNPIGSFVDEALELDIEASVLKDDVFACFKHWAVKKNIPFGTELAFKRKFLAATQEHGVKSQETRNNGKRNHLYIGIKLNQKAQEYVDTNVIRNEGVF
jgi:hypothetical protein